MRPRRVGPRLYLRFNVAIGCFADQTELEMFNKDESPEARKQVQFHARTIVAEVQNGALRMGVTDFSRTPIIAVRPRTLVKLDAGVSPEEAMAALWVLREAIEANGLRSR
jgi:hypothetical protein